MKYIPYDQIANEYYNESHKTCRNFDETSKNALKEYKGWIPSKGLILDIGCGRGRCKEFLDIDCSRVIQLDSSQEMLKLSPREECLLQVHHSAEKLPFIDSSFSCITSFLCDPFFGLDFLKESFRVLQPNGLFIATTPSYEWGRELRKKIKIDESETRFILSDGKQVKVPSILASKDLIISMLKRSGFSYESIKITGHKLPNDVTIISKDVIDAANELRCEPTELDLVYLIIAKRSN